MPRRAQTKAMIFLRERGGEGVIDKRGKVVAGGERLFGATSDTWRRLIARPEAV